MTRERAFVRLLCIAAVALAATGCRSLTVGDTFRYQFIDARPNAQASAGAPGAGDLELRSKVWRHEWRCNVFDTCLTDYDATMYAFDKRNGRQLKWNRIEVFQTDTCDASPADRRNYKTVTDADSFTLGWGRDRAGKFDRVSAYVIFYGDWGSVSSRVLAKNCA
jgi:hypothetical protein